MFTPLVQGKESRILEERLIVPGRFRAHAAGTSRDTAASPTSHASNGVPSHRLGGRSSNNTQPSTPRTPTKRRIRRLSTRNIHHQSNGASERTWLLRPSRDRVETWLDAWWKRWLVLVIVPSVIVWVWCAIPFPVSDPYDPKLPWPDPGWNWSIPILRNSGSTSIPSPSSFIANLQQTSFTPESPLSNPTTSMYTNSTPSPRPELPDNLPVDINFWFFLFIYYGAYLAVALIWVTCLFNLYRLNWWPRKLGGRISYFFFWSGSLFMGAMIHYFDIFGISKHRKNRGRAGGGNGDNSGDWERKTFWVSLAFGTMAMPAIVCFGKLRRDRRMTYRHSLTEHQRTFLERQLGRRIPKSYIRFLWFVACIAIAIFSGLAGQAYLSVYLNTLPHGSVESVVYVWTWIISCGLFGNLTGWILEKKVGSQALDFVFRLYFQLVYHVFYRTLFARLRKAEQFLYIQLLSSIWIITFYPAYMSRTSHKLFKWLLGAERTYTEHAESVAINLYVRNLSENVTMVAFLGWLTILHFGPNREVYPFFDFSEKDPYNYRRTALSSLIIWFFELLSSFFARLICNMAFKVDVTNVGLDTLRDYPELLPACVWASVHVCMDILLFLVTYNFR